MQAIIHKGVERGQTSFGVFLSLAYNSTARVVVPPIVEGRQSAVTMLLTIEGKK